jgi:hypothetical protein
LDNVRALELLLRGNLRYLVGPGTTVHPRVGKLVAAVDTVRQMLGSLELMGIVVVTLHLDRLKLAETAVVQLDNQDSVDIPTQQLDTGSFVGMLAAVEVLARQMDLVDKLECLRKNLDSLDILAVVQQILDQVDTVVVVVAEGMAELNILVAVVVDKGDFPA